MLHIKLCLLAFITVCLAGCASESVKVTPPDHTVVLKQALSDVSETGQLGSGAELLTEQIESLKETDPEKANQLEEAFTELKNARGPREVKKKASEMLEML